MKLQNNVKGNINLENENNLINLAKKGDDVAFEKLLTNYKSIVTGLCRRYFLIGGDVDDLIQEGMIGLYKAVKTFDGTKNISFSNYAKTIVERQIINAIKKANSNKNLPLNESVALNNQGGIETVNNNDEINTFVIKSNLISPEKLIQSQESVKDLLVKIKKQLSPFEITVLEQYLEGYSYIQIAQNLNQPTKSIDNALNRIKNKLKFLKTNRSE